MDKKCQNCVNYSLLKMITGHKPYGYSGDIPCLRCRHYFVASDEFVEKDKAVADKCNAVINMIRKA